MASVRTKRRRSSELAIPSPFPCLCLPPFPVLIRLLAPPCARLARSGSGAASASELGPGPGPESSSDPVRDPMTDGTVLEERLRRDVAAGGSISSVAEEYVVMVSDAVCSELDLPVIVGSDKCLLVYL